MTCSSVNSKVLMFAMISPAASLDSELCSESGPGARPMDPAWVLEIPDECLDARVPFLFKQWGNKQWGNRDMRASPLGVLGVPWES